MKKHRVKATLYSMAAVIAMGCFGNAHGADELNLSRAPLFLAGNASPLILLVMGKDHKLYYEAYNDASDLNGDGTIEIGYKGYEGYKPKPIDYYGYFDSYKCYNYSDNRFEPTAVTTDKTCSNAWSGDFLNYLTTSRMDALRKVLYGGHRVTDTASETVLAGAFIPQDAHSWGKEYTSSADDGYDISQYTPFSVPTAGNRHLFAVTSLSDGAIPVLRVLQNRSERIWEWVSKNQPVAGNYIEIKVKTENGEKIKAIEVKPKDYQIRVLVCDSLKREKNCQQYGTSSYKPIGLLQKHGENDSVYFGLLTGSYAKNMSGGVLRKNVGSITDEINPDTGEFDTATNTNGIINTIDSLRVVQFDYLGDGNGKKDYQYGPNAWIATRPMSQGEQPDWGNPIAEMMYEGLRYFAGKKSPTAAYSISASTIPDASLGLPVATWKNPYASTNFPHCSKPFQIVISDINPSYDTDQLPGSYFQDSGFSGDVNGLSCEALADTISSHEPGVAGKHFIGRSGTEADGAPSVKIVTSLGNIRGLAPEEPTKQGGYYSASVAYFGHTNDLHSAAEGEQKMSTFSVALASPLPKIEIPINGQTVTLVPFAKSVGGCLGISGAKGHFQPTDQIVDFYAETVTPTYGKFRINYEDVEQGADHDMDAIVEYEYRVQNDDTIDITLTSTYALSCITQHAGYVISGTTADGVYLEVRDDPDRNERDVDYFLDTPPTTDTPGIGWQDEKPLPLTATRTFTPGNTSAATLLKDPLWYAAKWGSFNDRNNDDIPQGTEWDINNDNTPDNYFLVTNALTLEDQLTKAFDEIVEQTSSSASVALNTGSISANSHLYQVRFNSGAWFGQLVDFSINSDGSLDAISWEAAELLDNVSSDDRKIVTYNPSSGLGIPFRWPADPASPTASELDVTQSAALNTSDGRGSERLNYIRGADISGFRERAHKLGDIVHSSPVYVGKAPAFRYPDTLETASYSTFKKNTSRDAMVYVGANDGMLHAFDAATGEERFAYVPNAIIKSLNQLSNPNYSHRYYVDGAPIVVDAFFDGDGDGNDEWRTLLAGGLRGGGQGIFALDVTNPAATSESSLASKVLWEFTDADDPNDELDLGDPDLGYTYSEPNIIRMHNGKWAVAFGNGYNNTESDGNASTTGNAVLYIVDAGTGTLIQKIDTGVGFADDPTAGNRPNGLATVAPIDADGDFIVDYIYGGDLFGNLWKFDVTGTTQSQWKVAYGDSDHPEPLFTAQAVDGSYQPITTRPQVGRHPAKPNTFMVYFGTGKYLVKEKDDSQTGQAIQTFYGIWDKNDASFTSFTRDNLLQQKIMKEVSQSFDTDGDGKNDTASEFRVTTEKSIDWETHQGWYLDLINTENNNTNNYGEKQVSDPILRNGRIIFTTLIPSDELCDFGGTSWLMELDAASGARLPFSPFDYNKDGIFGRADYINAGDTDGDRKDNYVPASGKKSEVGIISTPGIISGTGTGPMHEFKYASGSTGEIEVIRENAGSGFGRLSWIQLR